METTDGTVFQPGTLVDVGGMDETMFIPGQLMGGGDFEDELNFVSGQMGIDQNGKNTFVPGQVVNGNFVHGQTLDLGNGMGKVFVQGEIVTNAAGQPQFVPGVYMTDEKTGKETFVHGMNMDSLDGTVFVEGKLHKGKGDKAIFVPGQVAKDGTNKFVKAEKHADLVCRKSPEPPLALDGPSLSIVFKKSRPRNGFMITNKDGHSQFYREDEVPPGLESDPNAEIIPGRMECGEDGPTFVPGLSMELNGIKTFIPGKVVKNENGTETFVPGKMIHTKNGPKFVSGQVIQTEDGEKFLPGVVMTDKDNGKIFVPAMEIQTKSGPMLIPGQVAA